MNQFDEAINMNTRNTQNRKKYFLLDNHIPESINKSTIYVIDPNRITNRQVNNTNKIIKYKLYSENQAVKEKLILEEKHHYLTTIDILALRLNEVHNVRKETKFWETLLGLNILMLVSKCLEVNKIYRFCIKNNVDFILPQQKTIYVNTNLSEHRSFLNYDFDSIISLLILLILFNNDNNKIKINYKIRNFQSNKEQLISFLFLKKIVAFLYNKILSHSSPKILILNVLWHPKYIVSIILKSRFRVGFYQFVNLFQESSQKKYNFKLMKNSREHLRRPMRGSTRIQNFILYSTYGFLPCSILEDYESNIESAQATLNKFKSLSHILDETLTENSRFILACSDRNSPKIYLEHNFIQHHFAGNVLWLYERIFDKFYSIGWKNRNNEKFERCSSNFTWKKRKINLRRRARILYISGRPINMPPIIHSGYHLDGDINSQDYFELKNSFFCEFSHEELQEFYYKEYPKWRSKFFGDEFDESREFKNKFGNLFYFYDANDNKNTISLLNQTSLVVVDYLSTGYIQSLLANVPTIILVDHDKLLFTEEYKNFYKKLIDVNIFQTDPIKAAILIKEIKQNPIKWWLQEIRQSAVKDFLRDNIRTDNTLNKKIISLI